MLLVFEHFGGIIPKISDPRLIPDGKGQAAKNCRFDHGGIIPLGTDQAVATPTKTGTKLSIYLYQDLYWFSWITDVDACLTPTPNDTWKRVYFTEGGALKVTDSTIAITGGTNYPQNAYLPSPPAPTLRLVATATGTITNTDPTLQETRYYTYTYVNGYGDEGPPCAALSNKVTWSPGQHVTLSTTETIPSGAYNLANINIYRTNMDANGNEQYQIVYQVAVSSLGALPNDTVDNAALAEVLQTTEWDGAPSNVTGLVSLPNEGLACYTGNVLCLSVPGFPHAWPVAYQKAMERPIMGLAAFGTTVVALTTGMPEAITFTDPSNSVPEKIATGYACSSKRSVVDMGEFTIYASPEGLVGIGQGVNRVLTEKLFSRVEWKAYTPSTISAYLWEGMYVGFYTTSGVSAGFIYDPKSDNFINLDFYATAGYRDPATGILYLQVGSSIVSFATSTTPRTMDVTSKLMVTKLTMLSVIKVLAVAYPVSVDIILPYISQTMTVTVTSKNPQRIPMANEMIDAAECRVYGTKGVSEVYLASTIEELPQ